MQCQKCDGENVKKCGLGRKSQQRWQCKDCKKKWANARPLGSARTDLKQAAFALNMLLEGMSIRATSRLTGIDKDTVQRLMETAGQQCHDFIVQAMDGVATHDLQIDEVWSFVGAKERTAFYGNLPADMGDAYVFTAIDRSTKLLVAFHVGKRTAEDANLFAQKLAMTVSGRPHVSTDGYSPYRVAIPDTFGYDVNHGMVVKNFSNPTTAERRRYSPPAIIAVKILQNCGSSQSGQVCTSHVERHNLTIRMQNRRFTRLTNAFSKKWENHEAMFALFAAWYNFYRPHMTLKTTPAVAAGLAKEPWTLERLLREAAKIVA